LTPDEVGQVAADCDGLIAGTEDIDIVLKQVSGGYRPGFCASEKVPGHGDYGDLYP